MLVDSFVFFDELDLLEGRLEYLYPAVDLFVLVESPFTHSGYPKPLHFLKNRDRFAKYLDKVVSLCYIPIFKLSDFLEPPLKDRQPNYQSAAWTRELEQRVMLQRGFEHVQDHDLIMVSDLDEIPSYDGIRRGVQMLQAGCAVVTFEQTQHTFHLGWEEQEKWKGTSMATKHFVKKHSAHALRKNKEFPVVDNGGWHLTYWGGAERVKGKLEAYGHQEFNIPEITNLEHIRECIREGKTLFDHRPLKRAELSTDSEFMRCFARHSISGG